MNRARAAIFAAVIGCATLTGCATNSPTTASSSKPVATVTPTAETPTATTALAAIAASVPPAKLTGIVTAENDSNHLLGRPSQYTSKVTFSDSRIAKSDAEIFEKGDVELGGAVEVFADGADAKARAAYIQAVTKSMPALIEYDYVHGAVLVRVSRFLTPAQAGEYKAAVEGLG